MGLCKNPHDEFISEKLRWIVTLSNGEKIYQDDDRPGEDEPKTWIRLKEYIKENNLSITNFDLQFITHVEEAAPPNKLGYYFVQAVDAVAFSGRVDGTRKYYIIGYLDQDGLVKTKRWMIPEIIQVSGDIREVLEDDPRLIVNKGNI
jgi:hypothetical protein